MPIYTFKLIDDCGGVEDNAGVTLPSAEVANQYASDVVVELMNRREDATRSWRLDVYSQASTTLSIILSRAVEMRWSSFVAGAVRC
jgi:hypothetical protein